MNLLILHVDGMVQTLQLWLPEQAGPPIILSVVLMESANGAFHLVHLSSDGILWRGQCCTGVLQWVLGLLHGVTKYLSPVRTVSTGLAHPHCLPFLPRVSRSSVCVSSTFAWLLQWLAPLCLQPILLLCDSDPP